MADPCPCQALIPSSLLREVLVAVASQGLAFVWATEAAHDESRGGDCGG